MLSQLPFLSVIIPVRNEALPLRRMLLQLLNQDYPLDRFEVLVVDGRSTDRTREVVRTLQANWPNIRLLNNPRRGASAGRNQGLRSARGTLVVFLHRPCELDGPTHLQELVAAFGKSGADCIGRPQTLGSGRATLLQAAIGAARLSPLGHDPASLLYTQEERFVPARSTAVAYRQEVFRQVGLFDETFEACADREFNYRVEQAGLTCYFTPHAKVRCAPPATLAGLFHQMARRGRGRMQLWRKHPDSFSPACFLPVLLLAGLVIGPVLACFSTLLAVAFGCGSGLYALCVLAMSLALAANRRRPALVLWLPAVFATLHVGAAWGVLSEWTTGRRRQLVKPQRAAAPLPLRSHARAA